MITIMITQFRKVIEYDYDYMTNVFDYNQYFYDYNETGLKVYSVKKIFVTAFLKMSMYLIDKKYKKSLGPCSASITKHSSLSCLKAPLMLS